MSAATIKEATKGKVLPKAGDRPELVVWDLVLDDDRQATILRKPDSPAPSGEVTVTADSEGRLKAKLPQQGGGGGKSFEADPRGLRGKNASSALHAAISLAETMKGTKAISSEGVVGVAGVFYDFIEKRAKVGE